MDAKATTNEIFALIDSSGKPCQSIALSEMTDFIIKELPEIIQRLVEILNKGDEYIHSWIIFNRLGTSLNVLFENGLTLNDKDIRLLIIHLDDPALTVLALKANPDAINKSLVDYIIDNRNRRTREWLNVLNMCFKRGVYIQEDHVRHIDFKKCSNEDVREFLTIFFERNSSNKRDMDLFMTRVFNFQLDGLEYIFDHVSEDRKRSLIRGGDRRRVQEIVKSRYLKHGIPGLDIIPDDMIHEIVSYL